eukprot:45056-Eustigmatos_ZCMA.PRE.1
MLMPWEYNEDGEFNDLQRMVTKTGRFVARAFMVNGQGCVTMLYASDVKVVFKRLVHLQHEEDIPPVHYKEALGRKVMRTTSLKFQVLLTNHIAVLA